MSSVNPTGHSEEKEFPIGRKSITALCTEAIRQISIEDWPATKEQMEEFVRKVAQKNQMILNEKEITTIATRMRTNTCAFGTAKK
jgi:DNA polymerase III delta subunit